MTFAQSRLRLLRNKIHLDGELLLLVLFQRPNVVTQAPSQDDEFSPFAHRLILHSLRPMFTLRNSADSVYDTTGEIVICESWNGVGNHCR